MSASMSKSMQAQGLSSSLGLDEETKQQKQGIVTILSSDCERTIAAATAAATSLRRTLSADMSSKKWLSQNGFSPMKKIASSEELLHSKIIADSSSSSEGEDDYEERKELEAEGGLGQFDIWSSIQQDKKKENEKPGEFDIWSSIISQKANEDASKSLPAPYIHPLVKRSQSSLSEKSLEICTENLGSETGSDVFSYPPSETGDAEEDKEEEQQPEKETLQAYEVEEDLPVPKYNYSAASKKVSPRSFPPPLPSLCRQDGPSLQMRSHRDNGRLVLEAVSVPSQKNFCARRQDGRLLLTFNNLPNDEGSQEGAEEQEKDDIEELEEEFGGFEEDDQEEKQHKEEEDDDETEEEEIGEIETEESRDIEIEIEQAPILSSGITSVHRLASRMNKPIGFVNRNPKWSEKLNEVVNFEDVKLVEKTPVAKSLPPRPRVGRLVPSAPAVGSAAAASSFNPYEYYWRTKSTAKAAQVPNSLSHQQNSSPLKKNNSSKLIVSMEPNQISNEQQNLLVLREKNGDYLVHNLRSCKESRRSFLFWEPHCIATS